MKIAELRGGGSEDYSNNSYLFSLARTTIIELIEFLKLGDLGACSPRKIFNL